MSSSMSVCRMKRAGGWYAETPAWMALRRAALDVRLWPHEETLSSGRAAAAMARGASAAPPNPASYVDSPPYSGPSGTAPARIEGGNWEEYAEFRGFAKLREGGAPNPDAASLGRPLRRLLEEFGVEMSPEPSCG